jgi:hypothetical protein
LIPFWGSGRSFIKAMQEGRWGAMIVHGGFFTLDIGLVGGLLSDDNYFSRSAPSSTVNVIRKQCDQNSPRDNSPALLILL